MFYKYLCPANPCTRQTPVSCKPLQVFVTLCSPRPQEREPSTPEGAQHHCWLLLAESGAASRPELLAGNRQQERAGPKGQCPDCPSWELGWYHFLLAVSHSDCQNRCSAPHPNVPDASSTSNQPDLPGNGWTLRQRDWRAPALLHSRPARISQAQRLQQVSRALGGTSKPLTPAWLNQTSTRGSG